MIFLVFYFEHFSNCKGMMGSPEPFEQTYLSLPIRETSQQFEIVYGVEPYNRISEKVNSHYIQAYSEQSTLLAWPYQGKGW